MIITREFEFDTEWGAIQVTADLDISLPPTRVIKIHLEDKSVLEGLKDFIEEWMLGLDHFECNTLRQEERDWHEAQQAEADREDQLLGNDEC